MLDTLLIQLNKVIISGILPLFQTKSRGSVWKQQFNPTEKELEKYGYLPNLTLVRNYSGTEVDRLQIQFSAPKLLYGTNYYGVTEVDYDKVIQRLVDVCQMLGLELTVADIEKAVLKQVAFSFNFYFPGNFPSPEEYLKKMNLLDIGKRYDKVKNTDFIESTYGYNMKLYNGQLGSGLYDKGSEIINKAHTPEEKEIVVKMERGELLINVLRMEVTLQNQTAVKQYLTTMLGGDKRQVRYLREVFNDDLAKAFLKARFITLNDEVTIKAIDSIVFPVGKALEISRKSGMSAYQAEAWIGHSLVVQQIGSLQYKKIMDKHYPRQRRYELGKKYQEILKKNTLPVFTLGKIFEECQRQINEFKVLKPVFDSEAALERLRQYLLAKGILSDRTVMQSKV